MEPQKTGDGGSPGPAPGQQQGDGGGGQPAPSGGQGQQGGQQGPTGPAEFQLKIPEGVTVDAKLLDGVKALAKEGGWKGEHLQKLVDQFLESQGRYSQKELDDRKQLFEQWDKDIRSDKVFGGDKWPQTEAGILRLIGKYGDPEEMKEIEANGVDHFPPLVKMLARISKDMLPDSLGSKQKTTEGSPPPPSDPEAAKRQLASLWYRDSMPPRK